MKTDLSSLAILGGAPAFVEHLHVGRPNIGDREQLLARLTDMLDRRWLTNNGPLVQEFEQRIADIIGVKHCIAMCNATIALEITARALGLHGEVIIPSFTFIATAHALQWQEITPVFCDIDPRTHTLDPAQVERLITPRHLITMTSGLNDASELVIKSNLTYLADAGTRAPVDRLLGRARDGRLRVAGGEVARQARQARSERERLDALTRADERV